MDTVIVIIGILALATIGLLAFCLTESRGKNTIHARRKSNVAKIEHPNDYKNDTPIKHNAKEVA